MSAAASVAEAEAVTQAVRAILTVAAPAALAMILTVDPLGFLAALASDWWGPFVKSVKVATRLIRR